MSSRRFVSADRSALAVLVLGLAAALACMPSISSAQTPFALAALGQNIQNESARDTGRGGWGMAASDTLTPGTRNTASLASLRHMALIVSGFGETTISKSGDITRATRGAYLPNARLALPLRPERLVLHVGFSIQRSMRFDTVEDIQFQHFGELVSGYERYTREGTLYFIPMGLSWRPVEGMSVGATINLVRGAVSDKINQVFTDPVGNYYQPNVRDSNDELSGSNATVSLLWHRLPFLQLGASVTTGYNLDMRRTVTLGGVAERSFDRFRGSMPPQYRAGMQLKLTGNWHVGADGQLARYSRFDGYPAWQSVLRDEWTVSAGFERVISFREHGRGYVQPWRFGYQQRQWAHSVAPLPGLNGAVREHAISVGTGFPFRNRLGSIDLALSYIWIGSQEQNGHRSRALRLGVSITGLERLVF